MHSHHSFFVQFSCQRLHLSSTSGWFARNQSKLIEGGGYLQWILTTSRWMVVSWIAQYLNNEHMMLLLGVARQQPKQILRVKLPSLLAVEIPTDDSYSSVSSKKTFLVALVAASFACASWFVGYKSGHTFSPNAWTRNNYRVLWTALTRHKILLFSRCFRCLCWQRGLSSTIYIDSKTALLALFNSTSQKIYKRYEN